ncbi:MAG: DNA translocase FtsK 4TM domain-containing protein, partial [Prevotellaceae bacterium]|nr:DNA translocase FtsK 4TM domain-containing protein [Prevotellaceae bacterium]
MAPRKPVKKASGTESREKRSIEKNGSFFADLKGFFVDERTRFITAVFLTFVAVYVTFAFVSYFFTGAADQSKLDVPLRELIGVRSGIQNWTSVVGAYIAEMVINGGFGLASFAALAFLCFLPFCLLKKNTVSFWKVFFHCCFWLIWLSIFLSFSTYPFLKDKLFFSLGGSHGNFASEWLNSYIGIPGSLLLLLGTLLFYSIISSRKTLPFLKSLFTRLFRKKKKQPCSGFPADEKDEPSVAVGTEIVPEDWVVKGSEEDEEFHVVSASGNGNVPFEINSGERDKKTEEKEAEEKEGEVELQIQSTEHDDPHYNLEKLGRYDPTLDLSHYKAPTLDLLKIYDSANDT